ncbi:hypothetical protein [Cupriavidus sp. CuC1]|uniref:hypothetical protein n=1 Tax=Cupriavidus sp. CuC1 TaxID=3373131 RepID=UPI0037D5A94B
MMNAEDALGLQEDLAIMRAHRAPASTRRAPIAQASSTESAMGAIAVALRANQDATAKLRANLDATMNSRNDVIAMGRASREIIDLLLVEVAKLKQLPVEDVKEYVYEALSRRYDRKVDEAKQRGSIKWDVRDDPEVMRHRDWYRGGALG